MENMEEQDIKEAKRARNFIWMAACDYDIEPLFWHLHLMDPLIFI